MHVYMYANRAMQSLEAWGERKDVTATKPPGAQAAPIKSSGKGMGMGMGSSKGKKGKK